ncbi:MAG: hypoxanthine phosphoribosyltransferase [Actinobacteria bacterium]|nr:hypoxanthine phosphoribosyltransferase [Actinomycetota bacterium]
MSFYENDPRIGEIAISSEELHRRVDEIGQQLGAELAGTNPLFVGVLTGAFVFLADLVRAVDMPLEIDMISVSSYGNATDSTGVVRLLKDLGSDIEGRDVVLVEDIIDSGLTIQYLRSTFAARRPASLRVVSLLARERHQRNPDVVDHVGFDLPEGWVVGYGLDAGGEYRHLDEIRWFDPEKSAPSG